MGDEVLSKGGLYLDDLSSKLRILDPQSQQLTHDLVNGAQEYLQSTKEFEGGSVGVLKFLGGLATAADSLRLELIGKRSLLRALEAERERGQERLLSVLAEKKTELEKLRLYHDTLLRVEAQQEEILTKLKK